MWKKLLLGLLVVGLVAAYFAYDKYQAVFAPNVPDELNTPYIYVPTDADYAQLMDTLTANNILLDTGSFNWVAQQLKFYGGTPRAGRFAIEPGWSNRQLINHLRGGKQSPVKVVLTNERLPEEIAAKVARFVESDSASIYQLLTDERYLDQHGYDQQTAISAIIPNTYEFYWNTSPEQFFERMLKEHNKFWEKENREAKAKKLGLTKKEVYTLASIVERETNQLDEKSRIAGVYLNRLKKKMLLQADPTVVFATRQFDLRRVLNRHLKIDSPYNTYKYVGLPPGPISMADIPTLDAVLNAEDHDYIFFCARGDGTGYHAFAETLAGHNANAARYRRNLVKRGLR